MEFCIERLDRKGELPVLLAVGTTSLGRHPRNTVALSADDRCVSGYHALIYVTPDKLLLQDMQSTNGTFVNGKKIQDEHVIKEGDEIGLGMSGPRFRVVRSGGAKNGGAGVNITPKRYDAGVPKAHVDPANDNPPVTPKDTIKKPAKPVDDEPLITPTLAIKKPIKPVSDDPPAPPAGAGKKTIFSKRVAAAAIAVVMLTALILAVSLMSGDTGKTKTPSSASQRFAFKRGETSPGNVDDEFDGDAGRSGMSTDRSVIEARIDAILRRFGERDYQIPAEMVERVEYYLNRDTGPRRRTVAMYMVRRKQYFPMFRRIFTEKNIPLDLAYVSIVESGLDPNALSHAGARGLWQFMPKTGRHYGLEVSDHRDERTDPEKSTYAAAAYFKDLIAIFGSKSSVMLCMAAYNAGENRIINALKRIDDPVNNRDFWYLYKRKWLAEETNEYIPQILALIIISEHMEEYGFEP